ncbi:MAG: hypothetical protein LJE95_08525, partial [Acidobacteria bacterium]|nr:hypothetical protein [Acidobacteriota bacterium]
KIAAAVLLTVASAVLPLGMAFFLQALVGGGTGGGLGLGLAVVIALAVIAVALGHAAAVMLRTRSHWQLLDLVGLVAVVAGVWWTLATLGRWRADGAYWITIGILLMVLPASLLLAGAVQTTGGRSDPVRGHRLLSLTLWSVLAVVTAVLVLGARWLVTPTPDDLTQLLVPAAPGGSWLAVGGECRRRAALMSTFLLDTSSGRWLRLPNLPLETGYGAIAQDGRRAVWTVPAAGQWRNLLQVVVVNLDSARPAPTPTSITLLPEWYTSLAISPQGTRVAIANGGTVTVSTLPRARQLVAARLPGRLEPRGAFFLSRGLVRIYGWVGTDEDRGELWIGELDVTARKLSATGSIRGLMQRQWDARLDSSGERMVLLRRDAFKAPRSVNLYDARSGVQLVDLTRSGWRPTGGVTFLADGGIALVERNEHERRLRVVALDGGEQTTTLPPLPGRYRIGQEAAPGTVLVGVGPAESLLHKWRTLAVTPGRNEIREVGRGCPRPTSHIPWMWTPWVVRTPQPGSVETRLLTTGTKLELLDPSLTTTRVLAGRS